MRVDMIKLLILQNALAAIRADLRPVAMGGYANYQIAVDIINDVIDDLKIWRNHDATVEELNYACAALRTAREYMKNEDETIDNNIFSVYEGLVDILHEVEGVTK